MTTSTLQINDTPTVVDNSSSQRRFARTLLAAGAILFALMLLGGGCILPEDGPHCGDLVCDPGEVGRCAVDCASCGDGRCDPGESCAQDCGSSPQCGNGVCETGESVANCLNDCAPGEICGNGICGTGENTSNCAVDCQASPICGNGVCEVGESPYSCPTDCATCTDPNYPLDCGDGTGCWQGSVSCQSEVFSCGGWNWRCNVPSDEANCCYDSFVTCQAGYPFYCPSQNQCYSDWSDYIGYCPDWTACSFTGSSCS